MQQKLKKSPCKTDNCYFQWNIVVFIKIYDISSLMMCLLVQGCENSPNDSPITMQSCGIKSCPTFSLFEKLSDSNTLYVTVGKKRPSQLPFDANSRCVPNAINLHLKGTYGYKSYWRVILNWSVQNWQLQRALWKWVSFIKNGFRGSFRTMIWT